MSASALMLLLGGAFMMLKLGKNTGSFPRPLKPAEEQEYLEKFEKGDIEARNILIEHNLRLVAHIVKKYYTQCEDIDDLISIGTIGLIKGITSYKKDKGVKLATYCSRCIENEILMYFRSVKRSANEVSLSETIEQDGEGGSICIMDVISDEEDMLERVDKSEMSMCIRKLVDSLPDERERKIIKLRYGIGGGVPKTQREVAAICGISRSYVSRIEKKALERLKEILDK